VGHRVGNIAWNQCLSR